jgi:hypothetical protein
VIQDAWAGKALKKSPVFDASELTRFRRVLEMVNLAFELGTAHAMGVIPKGIHEEAPKQETEGVPEEDWFKMPRELCKDGRTAWVIMEAWRKSKGYKFTGGIQTYWHPAAWAAKGNLYGVSSTLIVFHDGGDLSNWGSGPRMACCTELHEALKKEGLYIESCTGTFDAIYRA